MDNLPWGLPNLPLQALGVHQICGSGRPADHPWRPWESGGSNGGGPEMDGLSHLEMDDDWGYQGKRTEIPSRNGWWLGDTPWWLYGKPHIVGWGFERIAGMMCVFQDSHYGMDDHEPYTSIWANFTKSNITLSCFCLHENTIINIITGFAIITLFTIITTSFFVVQLCIIYWWLLLLLSRFIVVLVIIYCSSLFFIYSCFA